MIARKGKCLSGNTYHQMKEIFIKYRKSNSLLELCSSEDIPNFINHDISESNMKCNICITQLCNYMTKKLSY